ncbi:DUF2155 domain-containing protein [Rhizorhapis sp. SPR117]|nr:DUF2155 domain-containing protein [Rhizorhapis sp. SPR117]
MNIKLAGAVLPALLMLGACSDKLPSDDQTNSGPVEVGNGVDLSATGKELAALPGTPMAERVAVIGLLNKRNGLTRDLTMKPGEALRVGNVIVRLRACETTAPWEEVPETGAFVQLDVHGNDKKWRRIFSGWLFKERPERNVVEHGIYDVWVKSCKMSWPETGPDTVKLGKDGAAANTSSAEKSPATGSTDAAAAPETPPTIAAPAPASASSSNDR